VAEPTQSRCPHCGATRRPDESFCPACLLDAASPNGPDQECERIFQEALGLAAEARPAFIRNATLNNETLFGAVRMLMEGYEEAGGDTAAPTTEATPKLRADWAAAGDEAPGTVIHHFRLVRLIGEGGMGSVWRAEQTAPVRRTVALKVIKLGMDTREVVKRFERERQTLALLNHPNIAQVYEAGATAAGRPYFAMELVEGRPITAYCETAGLDVAAVVKLFREVCAAVEHAHQKGVIHRDLKPSNILVSEQAVKVIDFGVAKATQTIGDTPLFTRQAQILGTPAYMSPEQARSAGVDVDTRTDVYSLGVVLYELLTGVLPIDSGRLGSTSIAEMQRIILEEEPPTPSTRVTSQSVSARKASVTIRRRSRWGGDLDWVVMKAIRKDRNDRYASAAALSEDLRRHLAGEPVAAVPPTWAYRVGKFVRRNRAAVAAGAAIVVALLAGLIVSLFQVRRANQALAGEAQARQEATLTLADMYTRSGLSAAENGDDTRAELWFADAAVLGAKDPDRADVNRRRATAWRAEAMTAVRAFETGFEHMRQFDWNPSLPALIVQGEGGFSTQIWDLDTERQWSPGMEFKAGRAAWDSSGNRLAVLAPDGTLQVLEFPSGKALARLSGVRANNLAWSPDDVWIAGGNWLWNWRTNERRSLPQSAWRIQFSRDGKRLLLQWEAFAGTCAVQAPEHFLHAPVPAHSGEYSGFLGDEQTYVIGHPGGGLTIRDATTGSILEAHTNGISGDRDGLPLRVSADGRFIARGNQVLIDRKHPGSARFPRHQGQFTAASFSPDGSLLASGGYDNRLELWSLPDGTFLGEVGHHHTGVVNLEFSPDGKFVASGEDGLVRVWRVERPALVRHVPVNDASLAMISPDGKLVAASGFSNRGGEVRETQAFEISTGRPAGPKIVPGGLLMDGTFSHDGTWIALAVSTTPDRRNSAFETSGGFGNVQLWNPVTGQRLGEAIPMPSEPRGLGLHPQGRWLGVCCAGGEGVEIDLSNRTSRVLFNHQQPANADATLNNGRCAYSADGRVLAMWGLANFINVWDREQARPLIKPFDNSTTFDLTFHDHVIARAVVASSMRIEFRDLRTGAEASPAIPFINWPLLTRFNREGDLLLTAGGGRTAQVWDWRQGRLLCPMLPHSDSIMGGCFVPGTPWVITGGHDGKIKFWDRRTGMMLRPPLQRDGWVLEVQLTPDAVTLIASGLLKGRIELIDLHQALPESDLSPTDGRLLAEIDADAEIHPGGGLANLTPQMWLKKWREFRERNPHYAGHRIRD
jgi:WD40 repeat protein